ncbi:MAG TPA: Flp pilus assembly protein CpaB [Actinomycetota bacterium]|nr:Flp pilus assembly protein CpaB [Actinomycetota bacterium]
MFRRKWPTVAKAYLALAAVSALGAFGIARGYAQRLEALHPAVGTLVPVVIAAGEIARGSTISSTVVEVRPIPSAYTPPGAFGDVDEVDGRIAVADLAAGEPITRTRVSSQRVGPIAALVPPGLRAFAIDAVVPQGALQAGDRVDVLATFGGGHPHTETVAVGLEVLLVLRPAASGEIGGSTASEGPRLVLLVAPDASERLAYAQAFGEITVTIEGAPAPTAEG